MPKKTDIIVKESNTVARARILPPACSVWEERIIACLVAKNRQDDTAFAVHKISVGELAATARLSNDQHQKIRQAVKKLMQTGFEIPQQGRGVKFIPVFALIGIDDDGNIEAQINHLLKPHYLELDKQFALRSLPEFRALSSTYSQQLYRFLNSWKSEPEKIVSLEELHALLDTPQSFRKDFKAFRTRVLEVAHREINASTSLEFDWEPVKQGLRKTIAVRFTFRNRRREQALRVADKAHEILDMFKRIAGQDLPAEAL
jgi:plasmid replication initiation protein